MEGNQAWKKAEELEVDFVDLIRRLFGQWKQIAVCALAAAILFGGFYWIKSGEQAASPESAPLGNQELEEGEQQAVEAAIMLSKEIQGLEEYMDKSILMQIDPYKRNRMSMLYRITGATRETIAGIVESYQFYLTGGDAVSALGKLSGKGLGMETPYLQELITVWQKTDGIYRVTMDEAAEGLPAQSLFYVEVAGKDKSMAQGLADSIQDILKEYEKEVRRLCGGHSISLISSAWNERIDSDLADRQRDKRLRLSSAQAELKSMTDAFHEGQMEVYKRGVADAGLDAGADKKDIEESGNKAAGGTVSGKGTAGSSITDKAPSGIYAPVLRRSSMKYALIGLLAGIFGYCGVYACWYLLSDTVKSAEEFQRYYTFPFYGSLPVTRGRRAQARRFALAKKDSYGEGMERLLNRIRLVCRKQDVAHLCLAADFMPSGAGKQCMEEMAGQLQS